MEQIEAKRILQRKRDKSWFGSSYNVNLYRGCPHGCIYCDSRSACYGVEDFARVRQFLLDCPVRQKGSFTPFPIVPSQRVMGLRQALFAPKESVDIDKAEGRISAQVKITCPPGIPLVMPGERLHKELRKILKNSGIFVMDVVK